MSGRYTFDRQRIKDSERLSDMSQVLVLPSFALATLAPGSTSWLILLHFRDLTANQPLMGSREGRAKIPNRER